MSSNINIYAGMNAFIAIAYCAITIMLLLLLKETEMFSAFYRGEEHSVTKRQFIFMTLCLGGLFGSFIFLCGLTHLISATKFIFFEEADRFDAIELIMLSLCSVVSVATALVMVYLLPALRGAINKFELTDEGKVSHLENYIVQIVDMFQESIAVVSPGLYIERGNKSTEFFFGPHYIGKNVGGFIHPDDFDSFSARVKSMVSSYDHPNEVIEYRILTAATTASTTSSTTSAATTSSAATTATMTASYSEQEVGEFKWVESTLSSRSSMSNSVQQELFMITRDIHERKQSELMREKIAAAEALEATNSAKLRYIACTAHDLKTPLQSFCFVLDLLRRSQPLSNEQQEFIATAETSIDLMKLTIGHAMDISKCLSGGVMQPRRSTVNLHQVLQRVHSIIEGYAKQVPLSFHCAVSVYQFIVTDEEWLLQMLLDFLTNACKYTETGWIQLSVSLLSSAQKQLLPAAELYSRQLQLQLQQQQTQQKTQQQKQQPQKQKYLPHHKQHQQFQQQPFQQQQQYHVTSSINSTAEQDYLLFEVTDTGIGVDESRTAESLFGAFAQMQEGQNTGTGLGLYGLRMRAQALSGACGVRCNAAFEHDKLTDKRGSTFWFLLPYVPDHSLETIGLTRSNSNRSVRFDCTNFPGPPKVPSLTISTSNDRLNCLSNGPATAAASGAASSPISASAPLPRGDLTILNPTAAVSREQSPQRPWSSLEQQQQQQQQRQVLQGEEGRGLTAIVIDDSLSICKLMNKLLLSMGFSRVELYYNGSQGLEAMKRSEVDFVFSDVQMPVMTGPEMIKRFRAFEEEVLLQGQRSKRQVAIAVTANGQECNDALVGDSSFDFLCPKPLSADKLTRILTQFRQTAAVEAANTATATAATTTAVTSMATSATAAATSAVAK